jgi:hypothetical protein
MTMLMILWQVRMVHLGCLREFLLTCRTGGESFLATPWVDGVYVVSIHPYLFLRREFIFLLALCRLRIHPL